MKKIIMYAMSLLALATTTTSCGSLNNEALMAATGQMVQAMTITDEQMAAYVHQYVEQMDAKNKVLPANNPYSQRLSRIISGISSVDGIPLNFKVYQTNEVNAFACADGSVRVYTGLMDLMSDDEVLGVLGHEIGHVAHHDTKNAFKQALLNTAARNALAANGGIIGQLSASQLGELGDKLLQSKFSRSQESKADAYGYDFLKIVGKNPAAMAKSLKKLQQVEQAGGRQQSQMMNLFSTHPDIEKRIQDIEKRMAKDGITY